jgi:hypothetical protein
MSQQVHVQIATCQELASQTKTSKASGKQYTVYSWTCTGMINGQPAGQFALTTLSGKNHALVQAGASFTCEIDVFQGNTFYKIPTPPQGVDCPVGYQGPTGAAPAAVPPATVPAVTTPPATAPQMTVPPAVTPPPVVLPPTSGPYTMPELEALFHHCFDYAQGLLGSEWAQIPDIVSRLQATLFIAAKDLKLKVTAVAPAPGVPAATAPVPGVDAAMVVINRVIEAKQLRGRVNLAAFDDATLKLWFTEAAGSESMFETRLVAALTQRGC